MKNQIERASRGAPDARQEGASQGALRAAIALRKEVAAKTIWAGMFIDGEGYNDERDRIIQTAAGLIDRESGHVVLLEALRNLTKITRMHVAKGIVAVDIAIMRAEAAIQQAERT